jgi:signal transduction histidine kinase
LIPQFFPLPFYTQHVNIPQAANREIFREDALWFAKYGFTIFAAEFSKDLNMPDTGFSIHCPHCFEWSDWPDLYPQDFVIGSDEQLNVLNHLKDDADQFYHKKMLSCKNVNCPAPFQCFIYPDPESAHHLVKQIQTWTLPRAFRLYRTDWQSRWPSYSGVLFCTKPVIRQKNIILEELIDRDFLNRAILGMTLELGTAITVYTANFLKSHEERPYWIPVEPYTKNVQNIPPKYNLFCKICRSAMMRPTLMDFRRSFKSEDYYKDDKICSYSELTGKRIDWNRCPRFLEARQDSCYKNDTGVSEELKEKWSNGTFKEGEFKKYRCWAGFKEVATPIIVHGHFVGVAICGQFVTDLDELPDVNSLVKKHPVLAPYKKPLELVEQLLRGQRQPKTELQRYTKQLLITPKELQNKSELLVKNAKRIADVANTRYRANRFRLEAVFKEEMLGRVDLMKSSSNFFRDSMLETIQHMREFWAFKAVYFLNCPLKTGELSLLAYCSKNGGAEFLRIPMMLGCVEPTALPTHPVPWLWNRDRQESFDEPWLQALVRVFQQVIQNDAIPIPLGRYYFIVLVPFLEQIYGFLFAVRDESAVSPLRPLQKGTISSLCQQAILETCTEIIERLLEFKHQESIYKTRLDALRIISASTAHMIHNWSFAARGALRRQRSIDPNFEGIGDIQHAINEIEHISDKFVLFSADKPLDIKLLDISNFINQEVAVHKQAIQDRSIEVKMPKSMPKCFWDGKQISQVLAELLRNAVYNTPINGHILVRLEPYKEDSETVKIIVENEGQGVKYSDKKRIFEPFFSNRADGTGLGLAIVEKIIKNHGGFIYEDGQPGKYSRFVIEIPVDSRKEMIS